MRPPKHHPAFTLVEMLLVVAIIVMLLALLLPSLSHSKELARRTLCLSQESQMGKMLMQVAAEGRSFFPRDKEQPDSRLPWLWDMPNSIRDELVGRGTSRDLFYCPSNQEQNADRLWNWSWYTVTGYFWLFQQNNNQPPLIGDDVDFARRYNADNPDEVELITDATIAQTGDFTAVKGGWEKPHRTNHLSGRDPVGGNIFFRDGSGRWRHFTDMQLRSPGPEQWF